MKFRKAERTIHLTPDEGLLGDISESGACLNLDAMAQSGSIFKLELTSRDEVIQAHAKVVHCRKSPSEERYNAGVQFINLPRETAEKLAGMISSYGRGVPIKAKIL
ncbi:MAG: hypothetical protein A2268_04160 [Candidatus Raymondbacteria bacterium RifOxyA12_full_50_37]|uniref:PilZ domain-containing protein n=1 Tax=Candidatus Raymondbacteria bacterium RIFOXYD12_FULL_49_13 TaxID=1817890 RepID=A0A1F7FBF7_UNCRA|nr:MAG: hypothetical protein A2268_04160 [Candidatus Raymondbacteria bacterium RifOxyA12_full_50_37]OGJ92582.1 MAG: hypothetical protein A2248_05790 [Candidatus Raymondbacteria bacterium RIFOXYA2_FULL_49_16]OGJ92856.1 MAG: hypothetical protein A2350_16780 [Candidatus Raymondbacteria bacterium RifOxyB12_full_50_8]OGJ97936.1 MAG: hypothetical protein A2453_02815 [Candidatus Raymondbacteria bacterium RIFOXYC2_FULL_50_21]OGK03951.1 MAG: hypothetical protein A2519_04470 [Candidatus Raymondbacteria b